MIPKVRIPWEDMDDLLGILSNAQQWKKERARVLDLIGEARDASQGKPGVLAVLDWLEENVREGKP